MDFWSSLGLVALLILMNGALAGSEVALISLPEGRLIRLERKGGTGKVLARLARDPNRFLSTIQIGITLAGFLAAAAAAITLTEPLVPFLVFLGGAAEPVAVVLVTILLSFVTLVLGELAPKRMALQRAESWGLWASRPLRLLEMVTGPAVWLLSRTTDLVVRLLGGEPGKVREELTMEELREMVVAHRALSNYHQEVLSGAFEVAERIVKQVLVPRGDVFVLDPETPAAKAIGALIASGHTRAPLAPSGDLDLVAGTIHLRDLVTTDPAQPISSVSSEPFFVPESLHVLDALREMRAARQQMALVVDEYGGVEGMVTLEDLVEELVGEIYDETDRNLISVRHQADGSMILPGRFPIHDLPDLGFEAPESEFTTVAGLVLERLGRIASPGDRVDLGEWFVEVAEVKGNTITSVRVDSHENQP